MGIQLDNRHKRRASGGKRTPYRKHRKFSMGRQAAHTKLGHTRIHQVRARGGAIKHRALRLESGIFTWGSEAVSRRTRIHSVVYVGGNNEFVRTNTLVRNAIVQVEAAPFRLWFESYYGVPVTTKNSAKIDFPKRIKGEVAPLELIAPKKSAGKGKLARTGAAKDVKGAKAAKGVKGKAPTKGAKAPAKGAKVPAKGAAKGAAAKKAPAKGEKKPAAKKDEKEAKPAAPAKGEKAAAKAPAKGAKDAASPKPPAKGAAKGAAAAKGAKAPAKGEKAAASPKGEKAPAKGEKAAEAPAKGAKAPAKGAKAPAKGEKAPAKGAKAPAKGVKAAAKGEKAPAKGAKAEKKEEKEKEVRIKKVAPKTLQGAKIKKKAQRWNTGKLNSVNALDRYHDRQAQRAVDPTLQDQFSSGFLLCAITSRPGQTGRVDGYILEGKELEFYQRKSNKKYRK